MSSLDEFFPVLEPHLPSSLVSPSYLEAARRVAASLPPAPVAGFECRLDEPDAAADFAVGFPASSPAARALADPGRPLPGGPAGERVRDFCAHLGDPGSPLAEGVEELWLEFDLAEVDGSAAPPAFLFGLRPADANGNGRAHSPANVVEQAIALLDPRGLPEPLRRNLRLCHDALPRGSRLFRAGALPEHPEEAARLCATALRLEQIPDYLTRVGWEDPERQLPMILDSLSPEVTQVVLSLDVAPAGVLPRIGIECYLGDAPLPRRDPRWERFLDHMTTAGLCRPEKRDGLLGWAGVSTPMTSRGPWPRGLAASAPPGLRRTPVFLRGIDHVKLVYRPGGLLEAKGYFGFRQEWLHPNRLGALTATGREAVGAR
jgi:hypothetical protein